jgi:hypothetical protein
MPINLVDTLVTGEFSEHNLLDMTANNLKGVGFYTALSEAFSQGDAQRCLGFLAIVVGDGEQAVYQYTGTTLDSWADPASWTALGTSGDDSVSTTSMYTIDLEQDLDLRGTYDPASSAVTKIDYTQAPETFELRYDSNQNMCYPSNLRGMNPDAPEFSQHWTHLSGPFAGKSVGEVLPGQVSAGITVGWGFEQHWGVMPVADGYTGLSGEALDLALSGTWNAAAPAAGEEQELVNTLLLAGQAFNMQDAFWFYAGDRNSKPVYFLGSGYTSGNYADPAFWTVLNDVPMQAHVTKFGANGFAVQDTDLSQRIVYPRTKRAHHLTVSDSRPNGFSTIQDLLDMRIEITLDPQFRTWLTGVFAAGSEIPLFRFNTRISVEL